MSQLLFCRYFFAANVVDGTVVVETETDPVEGNMPCHLHNGLHLKEKTLSPDTVTLGLVNVSCFVVEEEGYGYVHDIYETHAKKTCVALLSHYHSGPTNALTVGNNIMS
jgi:hypothetical protein